MRPYASASPLVPGLLELFRGRRAAAATAWLLLLSLAPLLTSCQYYRTKAEEVSRDKVSVLANSKQFIVHQGLAVWELQSPRLNGEVLEGQPVPLSTALSQFPAPLPTDKRSPRYRHQEKSTVLNLVHLYVTGAEPAPGQPVRIPLAAIQRLDLVEKDTGKTTASYVLGSLGVAIGAMVLLTIIVALTKSSCPYVYAHDGQQYRFVGEAYGGAIFAPAERDDYLPLPTIEPENGVYRLRISNELKERQYTNLAELWVVEHPAATRVLLDQRGRVQTLAHSLPPLRAQTPAGTDYTAQLQAADHDAFLFQEDAPGKGLTELELTFPRPAAAGPAKLVLRAQNSLWLDYLYGAFIEKFGFYYNTWAAQQKTQPPAFGRQWALAQGLPLRVYVETSRGWQLAETIPTVGPLAARDIVVPLTLEPGTGPVRVKLAAGFMFWEVDYAALDASPTAAVRVDRCRLQSARTEAGADARAALAADDTQRLAQLRPGTTVTLRYETSLPAPSPAGTRRTTFLHTKGYYEHIRDFRGLPQVLELRRFEQPGRFIEFSKEQYRHAAQQLTGATASR